MQRGWKSRYYGFLQRLRRLICNLLGVALLCAQNINPSIWHFFPLAGKRSVSASTGGTTGADPGPCLLIFTLRAPFLALCNLVREENWDYFLCCANESSDV